MKKPSRFSYLLSCGLLVLTFINCVIMTIHKELDWVAVAALSGWFFVVVYESQLRK